MFQDPPGHRLRGGRGGDGVREQRREWRVSDWIYDTSRHYQERIKVESCQGQIRCKMLCDCRCSTSKAFLRPVRNRPNFHISLNSQVLKILIDNKSNAAFGVRFKKGESVFSVLAKKEVILSAGTLNSAQLLMLSGVGPADHLAEMGIPLQADLPVGHNLMDHYGTGALTFTVDQPVSLVQTRYENIPSVLKYAIFGSGPLTVLGGVEVKCAVVGSCCR